MKRAILPAIILTALWINTAQADDPSAASISPSGSPGTATPTPYPQVAPPGPSRVGSTEGNGPLLPKIEMPRPPKDQTLPGLEQNDTAPAPTRLK